MRINPFIPPQPIPQSPFKDLLSTYNLHIASIGLFGLAIYQLSQKDYSSAMQSFMAGVAAWGVKDAVGRQEMHLMELKRMQMLQMKKEDK